MNFFQTKFSFFLFLFYVWAQNQVSGISRKISRFPHLPAVSESSLISRFAFPVLVAFNTLSFKSGLSIISQSMFFEGACLLASRLLASFFGWPAAPTPAIIATVVAPH